MPIRIDEMLPARSILEMENIFVMSRERAMHQDIRPLRILILNLMPTKIETETQLLRLLSYSPIQVDVELLQVVSHVSKNTSAEHLLTFYRCFEEVRGEKFDGMIITGAPVEQLPFERVDYWEELCAIFEWSKTHVYSTFHICWGAQAGLYYHHGIQKYPLERKLSGIYSHRLLDAGHPLVRGLDDEYLAPHSRYTTVLRQEVEANPALHLLGVSALAGVHLVCDSSNRNVFATGHSEYDRETLAREYFRDIERGLDSAVPYHYFPEDDPLRTPKLCWRSAASLLFSNWLNFFVYQRTPFDLAVLGR
ncbi:MAG: homoserine O-succinyltransferase [Oscillospiraceae bacterium]|jgi:homoserine O-succinyltransferase|nr:homoserine O-succinyltransferase [Oscillospiraceae bacterium]